MKTSPLPAQEQRAGISILWDTDAMRLQSAGCVLFILCMAISWITKDRSIFPLTMGVLGIQLGANCFRDKYAGPKPAILAENPEIPKERDELRARLAEITLRRDTITTYITRLTRFQLIWGGVYAIGESLVFVHACFRVSHLQIWVELPALLVTLGFGLWVLRAMFEREAAREI